MERLPHSTFLLTVPGETRTLGRMTAAMRPNPVSETAAILVALVLTLLSTLLVIRALEGRPPMAVDLDEVKVLSDADIPPPVSHSDAAPIECETESTAPQTLRTADDRCRSWIRRASY